MTNYRKMNFQIDDTPPGPVPRTPVLNVGATGDTTITLAWVYPTNEVDVDHWDIEIFEGSAQLGIVRVEGPETRQHTVGELTNGTSYGFTLQAVNLNGRSQLSNRVEATPVAAAIPAPTVTTVTGADGYATVVWVEGKPLPGKVTGHKYVAKRIDSGYEFEGDIIPGGTETTGTTAALDNDREYQLYLATVIDGKVGPYSAASATFRPTQPVPPYPPIWAHVDANKWDYPDARGKGCDWLLTIAAGSKNANADVGPMDITGYRYLITDYVTGETVIQRTIPSSQQSVSVSDSGPWVDGKVNMYCWARNSAGESQPTLIVFDTAPHAELPIDFGVFEEHDGYRFHIAEEDVSKWAKVNKNGVGMNFEALIIGAGGAGHGRTTIGGYGGHGGAGQAITALFKPFATGPITTKIGDGANYQGTAAGGDSNITVDAHAYIAKGGGTSTGKDNGTPDYLPTAQDVENLMNGASQLRAWMWNRPYSQNVGGAREWDKSNAPDANLYGQAGGGTNSSASNHGGNGGPGIVVVKYKISDVPAMEDVQLTRRQERKYKRQTKRLAKEIRKAAVNET